MPMKILVINPGSTSTKMAVYDYENPVFVRNIAHTAEELAQFDAITEQQDFRRQLVLDELKRSNISLDFDAVIGRGGLVKPICGGVYEINKRMLEDTLHGCVMHNHACNLGCLITYEIAGRRAFSVCTYKWLATYATHLHMACFEPPGHCPALCSEH